MNWNSLNTHDDSYESAFEILCIQLFEHYLRRKHKEELTEFFALSGSGGDGGVEAYGKFGDSIIGLQAKWFRTALTAAQIKKIKESVFTAKRNRPDIVEYIICLPKRVNSKKAVAGGKIAKNSEQQKLTLMEAAIGARYPELKITWWFENVILEELQQPDCQYIEPYWFGRNFLPLEKLKSRFSMQLNHEWLQTRYAPDLNVDGVIAMHYDRMCFGQGFKKALFKELDDLSKRLQNASILFVQYLVTGEVSPKLEQKMRSALLSFEEYRVNIDILRQALVENNIAPRLKLQCEFYLWDIKMILDKTRPTNIQRPLISRLSRLIEKLHQTHYSEYIAALAEDFTWKVKVFLGDPGGGKTQGLAQCTSCHLKAGLPALILPAQGTACDNWTNILGASLEYPGRNADEIFTALEALTYVELRRRALEMANSTILPVTLISVDGLEEDVTNWSNWYDRINDTRELVKKYPTLRFMFSARKYFLDYDRIPARTPVGLVDLPEGLDVDVDELAEDYFNHFKIQGVSKAVMNRIENLYALKLFCELYKGQDLAKKVDIITDLRSLLRRKIQTLEDEFKKQLTRFSSKHSMPVLTSLKVIAGEFYVKNHLERAHILQKLNDAVPSLNYSELEGLLDFLSQRGILTCGYLTSEDIFSATVITYYVSYRSIIEHVISEDIFKSIVEGSLNHIPEIAFKGMVSSLKSMSNDIDSIFPNETIVENILKRVFLKTGKLIGENGFLINGFQESSIVGLQMDVLAVADHELGKKYESLVNHWFELGHWHHQHLYLRLIRPATKLNGYFNAMWFHHKILSIPSVYERDKFLWTDQSDRSNQIGAGLEQAVYSVAGFDTSLYPFDLFDQEPLIYAWCLSSPSRPFREKICSSLLNWAGLNVGEWIKLLTIMIAQSDTQIIEDLASVNLGLSHKVTKSDDVRDLANWVIDHIFSEPEKYTSMILEGFRAIVEKALELKSINAARAAKARPNPISGIHFIPLAPDVLAKRGEEFYPLSSDLTWYVIKKAYQKFFPVVSEWQEVDESEGSPAYFLNQYGQRHSLATLKPYLFAQSSAIAYIREQFGFEETSGSLSFLPSHGEQGLVMYFAEKYVWQSVYYLQAYLSRHLKLGGQKKFVSTFTSLCNLPNPAEGILHNDDILSNYDDIPEPGWQIAENLVNTIMGVGKQMAENIAKEIKGEFCLDFPKWLMHTSNDGKQWYHLHNKVMLEEKSGTVYGKLTANMVLMKSAALQLILGILTEDPKKLHFARSLTDLVAGTSGTFYQNPSDVGASKFVNEEGANTKLVINDKEVTIHHSTLRGVKSDKNTELDYYLPTKLIRKFTGIDQLKGKRLRTGEAKTIGFAVNNNEYQSSDSQQLTCILAEKITQPAKDSGYGLVWFVEVFKRTTLVAEKDGNYLRWARKYIVWEEEDKFKYMCFWDQETTN